VSAFKNCTLFLPTFIKSGSANVSIICQELSKHFGTQVAVNQLNLSAKQGEIVGFLGPNGAGKSTTMKMITGYLSPTSGTISVCGIPVSPDNLEVKKHIGYLPESNPLYYDMYVVEYLEFIAGIHKLQKPQARIKEVIQQTGLHVEQHKRIGALSKGYKQRVGLCQAILHNPDVLILDEPTSGLDPNQILDIRNLIIELGKTKTILLSSHIMQEVEAMCQRVVVINKGNIVADDNIGILKSGAQAQQRVIILQSPQNIDISLFTNIAKTKATAIAANKISFSTQDEEFAKRAIMQICLDKNISIEQLQTQTQSLEDLFRTLTKDAVTPA
jgi:ABC-2 type transport system ATP-binding protein